MIDAFYAILTGLSSSVGSHMFDSITNDSDGSDDDSDDELSESKALDIDFSNQIREVVKPISSEAESPEDIPGILDGLEIEVNVAGEKCTKQFTDVSVDEADDYPWKSVGRFAECPMCGRKIHSSPDAFKQHWSASDECPGIDENQISQVMDEQLSLQDAIKGH